MNFIQLETIDHDGEGVVNLELLLKEKQQLEEARKEVRDSFWPLRGQPSFF